MKLMQNHLVLALTSNPKAPHRFPIIDTQPVIQYASMHFVDGRVFTLMSLVLVG